MKTKLISILLTALFTTLNYVLYFTSLKNSVRPQYIPDRTLGYPVRCVSPVM